MKITIDLYKNGALAQIRRRLGSRFFMKRLLLSCLAPVLLGQPVFALWAEHLVISPASLEHDPKGSTRTREATAESAQLERDVTVRPAAKGGGVSIVLKATEDKHKGYYLMVSKKRLAQDALDLRHALRSINLFGQGSKDAGKTVSEGFVEVRPLQSIQRNGESVIEIVLDRETALRSYVVWDFRAIYEKGSIIMDGGLWLTYDLPAFVEASQKLEVPKNK